MKKLKNLFICGLLGLSIGLFSCNNKDSSSSKDEINDQNKDDTNDQDYNEYEFLSDKGYAGLNEKIPDFSQYENTSAYREVTNYEELLNAIKDAQYHYTTTMTECEGKYVKFAAGKVTASNFLDKVNRGLFIIENFEYVKVTENDTFDSTRTYYEYSSYAKVLNYTQEPAAGYDETNYKGTVRVIEIKNDIDLGWKYVPQSFKPANDFASNSYVENYSRSTKSSITTYTMSSMFNECGGISKIKIEGTNDLLIYSKNGAKLTHGGFSLLSCDNVVFRNLEFDEMWQWEDASSTTTNKVGDYDAFGWAYFKIAFCGNIWIDHCTFGKSYDGQIDVSNPYYLTRGTLFRAPYGADGSTGVHISWCNFNAGSDDQDGYIYKMMQEIENDYQSGGKNYLYYNALRNSGITFENILYGIAIPQKKCFLDGDSGDEYEFNLNLRVSIGNCKFTNIEDRIPKVRGGVAYMYNSIVDSSEYYEYRTKLKNYKYLDSSNIEQTGVQSIVKAINGTWKCALVSQGVVCGNGGSVACKNVSFKGIEYVLKNNDNIITNNSGYSNTTYNGGYLFVNCSYQQSNSSNVSTTEFSNDTPGSLSESNFSWKTSDSKEPFEVLELSLDSLAEYLSNTTYGSGVKESFPVNWTKM